MDTTIYTLNAVKHGCFTNSGVHAAEENNTATGVVGTLASLHAFFVFDLPDITGTVSGAVLRLELEAFLSIARAETFAVSGVRTPAHAIGATYAADAAAGQAIFHDLGSGTAYGRATVTANDIGCIIAVALFPRAMVDIQAAAGRPFVIGVTLDVSHLRPIGANDLKVIRFRADSAARTHQLVVETHPLSASTAPTNAYGLQYNIPGETLPAVLHHVIRDQAVALEGMLRGFFDAVHTLQERRDLSRASRDTSLRALAHQTWRGLTQLAQYHIGVEQRLDDAQSGEESESSAVLSPDQTELLSLLEQVNSVLHANISLARRHLTSMMGKNEEREEC